MGTYNGDMLPIQMSRDLFIRLAPYARICSTYPQILMNKTATCVLVTPQLPPKVSADCTPNVIREQYISMSIETSS